MRRWNRIVESMSPASRRSTDKGGRRALKRCCLTLPLALLLAVPAWPQQKPLDLTEQSIEDLMNIEVTSVTKGVQKMSQVAAAVFVIGQEDIRHSGATSIPDLLRMAPGLDGAQINVNSV